MLFHTFCPKWEKQYTHHLTGHQETVIPTTGAAGANPGINLHASIVLLKTIFHHCQQRLYIYA